jgi:hypothetical protein
MNHAVCATLITASLLLAAGREAAAQAPEPTASAAGAVLTAPDRYYDAGRVPAAGPPLVHTFTLSNTGTAPLAILDVEVMCDCARYSLGATRLAPGESTTLELVLDIRNKKGAFYDGVWLLSDDPRQPRTSFYIAGEAYTRLDVVPEMLNFGQAPRERVDGAEAALAVEINDDAVVALESVAVSSPAVEASIAAIDDRHFRVTVRIRAAQAEALMDEWVDLNFTGIQPERVRVPVRGLVTGPIQMTARYLDLADFADSTPPEKVVYLSHPEPFTVTRVEAPPWLTAASRPLARTLGGQPVHVEKITFRLNPAGLPPAPLPQIPVIVHTDHPAAPRVLLFLEDRRPAGGRTSPADPAAGPSPR